jgi:hypothetical protein
MKTRLILFTSLMVLNLTVFSQQQDAWQKWSWLIGEWVNEGSGNAGQGGGSFSLKPDLDGQVLLRRNHAEYAATADKPATVHDDLMIIYPETAGANPVALYFDNEGHVIHYTIAFYPGSIVFTSQKTANTPIFRLTYARINEDAIDVAFEISSDGKVFAAYLEGKCVRKK